MAKATSSSLKVSGPGGIEISVVVPLFDEAPSVAPLVDELILALTTTKKTYEIILVNDGSTDRTAYEITIAQTRHAAIRGLVLARNYGQATALQAGFDHSTGRIIVTLDGDLQNDPADIPRMIATMEQSDADVVSGWRKNRQDDRLRIWLSGLANRLISRVTGVPLNDYGCTLKLYRREKIDQVRLYGDMHRFLPAVLDEVGAKIVEIEVNHRARRFGRSKYGLGRTYRVLLDLIAVTFLNRYLSRPMHFFGGIGLWSLLPGLAICLYLAALKVLFDESIGGRPLLTLGVALVLVGVVLITQGLIGEIVSRVLFESTERQTYRLKRPDAPAKS